MFEYEEVAPSQSPIQRDITKVLKSTSIGENNNLMFPKTSSVTLMVGENKPLGASKKPRI
jgi:hypothetical protein